MPWKETAIDWRELVYRGVETQELDYKAAQNWLRLSRSGKAKFVRHALALANTKGGYIIIGVGEDENGNPLDYQGLNDTQLKSFDPSIVGQFINLYADPAIDVDVVRPEVDGKHYAVLVVRPFSGLPHVCSDHCGLELQQGVFYIRTPDARSRPANRASELQMLVQRALRNQREVLGRMLRGVLYEGRQVAEPDAEREFQREYQQSERDCRQWLGPRNMANFTGVELFAYPTEYRVESRMLSDLSDALHRVRVPVPSEGFFTGRSNGDDLFFTNDSLLGHWRDEPLTRFSFLQLFQSGMFHSLQSLVPAGSGVQVDYEELARHIGITLRVAGEYFSELGLDDQLLTLNFSLKNTMETCLTGHGIEGGPFCCHIPDVVVRMRRTVADLCADTVPHAEKIMQQACERFNLEASRHNGLRLMLKQLLANE